MEKLRRKITYNLVRAEFNERGYELLSTEYVNNSTKLQYICPKHRDKGVQGITFGNFISGKGCPYCANRVRKTQEEYENELAQKKPNIKVIGKYVGLKVKIEHECRICGHRWEVLPDNMLHMPNGCPKCGKRAPLTQNEFIAKVYEINPNIQVIGEYKNHASKILFKCLCCDKEWQARPNNILNGKGCPYCKSSKGELKIAHFLDKQGLIYEQQKKCDGCKDKHLLPFDFYLPSKNLCIEYDGVQHYEPCTFGGIPMDLAVQNLESCQVRDKIKTEFCNKNGLNLLRISYFEYDNIEKILNSVIC